MSGKEPRLRNKGTTMKTFTILLVVMTMSALAVATPAMANGPVFGPVAINAFAQSQKCAFNPQHVRFVDRRGDQEVFASPTLPPLLGTCIAMCRQGRCEVLVQK